MTIIAQKTVAVVVYEGQSFAVVDRVEELPGGRIFLAQKGLDLKTGKAVSTKQHKYRSRALESVGLEECHSILMLLQPWSAKVCVPFSEDRVGDAVLLPIGTHIRAIAKSDDGWTARVADPQARSGWRLMYGQAEPHCL